ncbi:MAG TPA: rhodanese-like domain-containing protein [Burkholderiales bacterium]|jgi:rhodanese-related sulfurtransferase/predicted metal-dependent enzyme (double-stranded beta helix superfamily)
MTLQETRARAVSELIESVRAIESKEGVTRLSLDRIKAELIALASRSELFPPAHFTNIPGRPGTIYHLAEDIDGRFALYGSAGVPGKAQPPHNHTTWASIAGVYGGEHNVFYDRVDEGGVPGEGRLKKTHELTIQRGNACAMLPDDFHTIEVTSGSESLHLHLYGKTLEDLPDRITFPSSAGGKFARFMAKPEIYSPRITPQELRALISAGGELAILDVREEGVHARNHLFLAASAPLSHLELRIGRLVPRLATRIVLVDDDERLAQRAARLLRRLGYRNLDVLASGIGGWKAAGYELYSGMHVPSKAFGEHVEHHDGTPRIAAAELKTKLDAGEDLVVLDSRPMGEYRVMNIPGALDCPGAELVYRVHQAAPRPETLVVVNCAGRTRSIIGAQSLINAGIPNKVMALKNGTMGWHLAGLELERGQSRMAQIPSEISLRKAVEAAAKVAKRFGIRKIAPAELKTFQDDKVKTTYLFDVRSPEEYAAGHLHGSISAPGGQLVQATDTYAAVHGARIVLADDHGVRATMTASWLLQMGWPEVFVVSGVNFDSREPAFPAAAPSCKLLKPEELRTKGNTLILDFATSLQYRAGHIPGAAFAIRSRLVDHVDAFCGPVACTSPDGVLARFAAADLSALLKRDVPALEGGTAAWRAAGLPLETGETRMLEPPEDVYYKPYDHKAQIEAAMQDYLQWEVALLEQIRRDPDCRFKDFPAL